MDSLKELISSLNALTPLGLAGGLGYIIYLLVKNKRTVSTVKDNHLQHIEADLKIIAREVTQQTAMLHSISSGVQYLKGRINGQSDES